jgi:hypothetical protein
LSSVITNSATPRAYRILQNEPQGRSATELAFRICRNDAVKNKESNMDKDETKTKVEKTPGEKKTTEETHKPGQSGRTETTTTHQPGRPSQDEKKTTVEKK